MEQVKVVANDHIFQVGSLTHCATPRVCVCRMRMWTWESRPWEASSETREGEHERSNGVSAQEVETGHLCSTAITVQPSYPHTLIPSLPGSLTASLLHSLNQSVNQSTRLLCTCLLHSHTSSNHCSAQACALTPFTPLACAPIISRSLPTALSTQNCIS